MKYFEDFRTGEVETIPGYELTSSDIIAFARAWDPQPMHTDADAADALPLGGLIASGAHLLAITVRQLVSQSERVAVIAGIGWDEVRFLKPARPGDVLSLLRECIEVRPSSSKADRGVVRNRITLTNQRKDVLLSYIDILLVARRPGEATERLPPESEVSSARPAPVLSTADVERLRELLRDCWSSDTSSLWSSRNPARGQCGVTALVVNDHYGGEILKTRVESGWHFYNRIGGLTFDLRSQQFEAPIDYMDVASNRDEVFSDTNDAQYRLLAARFAAALAAVAPDDMESKT